MPFIDLTRSIEVGNDILLILLQNSGGGEGREESKQTDRLYLLLYTAVGSEMVVAALPELRLH